MTDTATTTTTATSTTEAPAQITPADAAAKLSERKADKEWTARLLKGDGPTVTEFHQLSEAKAASDRVDAAMSGTLQSGLFEITGSGRLTASHLQAGIEDLRNLNIEDKQIERLLKDTPISAEHRKFIEGYERELRGNQEFVKKYLAGDLEARREMTLAKLHKLRPLAEEKKP